MTAPTRGTGLVPSAREAAAAIMTSCAPLPTVRRPLKEALDLVLAEDVASPIDVPPWNNSAVDGYALRSVDVQPPASPLRVIEHVRAGQFPRRAVGPGTAIRVATGGPVPAGADAVVRQEDTEPTGGDAIRVRGPVSAGQSIRLRAEDCRRGDRVLPAGAVLDPAALGVLASIAHATVLVHPAPRVAYFGGGDEIADLDQADEILAGEKIASSNSYTLFGLIARAGGTPVDLGLARDTIASVREQVERARDADLLVTTAGVSVGTHDFLRPVLAELGAEIQVSRVRIRPGGPMCFGVLAGKPWIGLPGNPVSTMVTFELFVRPAIRRLMGHARPFRRAVPVRVAEPIALGPRLQHFLRAVVSEESPGSLVARLTGPQGSGILTSMVRANALLIVPEDRSEVERDAPLSAILLDDPEHLTEPPF
ncbi:MAG TPA: gephyrin-like molybdotransferase Glp [Gemmatimonadales bacterium]|nr:gephyrin-like molybdotransferase Glp [Gemmatimonadales bacterium]